MRGGSNEGKVVDWQGKMENKLREARGEICEKICLCDVSSDPTANISTKDTKLVHGREEMEKKEIPLLVRIDTMVI